MNQQRSPEANSPGAKVVLYCPLRTQERLDDENLPFTQIFKPRISPSDTNAGINYIEALPAKSSNLRFALGAVHENMADNRYE